MYGRGSKWNICDLFSYTKFSLARKWGEYFIANININKIVLMKRIEYFTKSEKNEGKLVGYLWCRRWWWLYISTRYFMWLKTYSDVKKTLFVKRYHFPSAWYSHPPFCNLLRPLYLGKNRSSVESTKSPAEAEKERWPSNSDSCIEGNFDRCFSSFLRESRHHRCYQICTTNHTLHVRTK